jgi:hypothetical protein
VQLFYAGTVPETGYPDGISDDGATHVLTAPSDGSLSARAVVVYFDGLETSMGHPLASALPGSAFASRPVPGGYEVELFLPWASAAPTAAAGQRRGFHILVGVKDTVGVDFDVEGGFALMPVVSSTCGTLDVSPACDSRTWCTPLLVDD